MKTKTRDIEPDSVIPRLPSDLTKESDSEDTFEGSSYTGNSGSFTGAVAWLVRGDKMLQTLGSLESLALYMPMNNRYKFLFMHEGDLGSPVYQQDVKDQWNVRIGQIEEENPGLAAKMTAMAEDIEFILVDLHAPNEIAQLARAGELKDAVYGNRFPGMSIASPGYEFEGSLMHRIPEHVPLLCIRHLLGPPYSEIRLLQ